MNKADNFLKVFYKQEISKSFCKKTRIYVTRLIFFTPLQVELILWG